MVNSHKPKKRNYIEDEHPIILPRPENDPFNLRLAAVTASREQFIQDHPDLTLTEKPTEKEQNESRERLLHLVRTGENVQAKNAIYELERRGWLHDGSLKGVSFAQAQLSGVMLQQAVLIGADFSEADLSESYIVRSNLESANLRYANFSGAIIDQTNLRAANLTGVNLRLCWIENKDSGVESLEGAVLDGADLTDGVIMGNWRGASFINSNLYRVRFTMIDLRGANFTNANLLETVSDWVKWGLKTIMPNGEPFNGKTNRAQRYQEPNSSIEPNI